MKKNMGKIDRLIRIAIAVVLLIALGMDLFPAKLNVILVIIASIFTLTSFVSFCPLYRLFGWNTTNSKD